VFKRLQIQNNITQQMEYVSDKKYYDCFSKLYLLHTNTTHTRYHVVTMREGAEGPSYEKGGGQMEQTSPVQGQDDLTKCGRLEGRTWLGRETRFGFQRVRACILRVIRD